MESLADLLRGLPGGRLQQGGEAVRMLLADPELRAWQARHPSVTERDLRLHLNVLYQYVNEKRSCSACPGLDRCLNDYPGHYTTLTAEAADNGSTHIYDAKVPCSKYTTRQAQDAIRARIHSFYIEESPLEMGYSPEDILDIDLERAKAVGALLTYIDRTKRSGLQREGLYLCGDLGTGKTFLMCYMLYELAKNGLTGTIVYMPDFSEDLKGMFQEPQKLKETIDLLKETDLLVLDDIGAENMNPWLRDHVLGSILNYRMNRKPTFFTSNHTLGDLEQHFSFTSKDGEEEFKGKRIMDRIRHFVQVVEVGGFNKRGANEKV